MERFSRSRIVPRSEGWTSSARASAWYGPSRGTRSRWRALPLSPHMGVELSRAQGSGRSGVAGVWVSDAVWRVGAVRGAGRRDAWSA
jgi:hypothetical protein